MGISAGLVGRGEEVAAITAWLEGRLTDSPSGPVVLLVGGEAGIGTTAVLRGALADALASGPAAPEVSLDDVRRGVGAPAVLLLDDLQDRDEATLAELAGLAAGWDDQPVAVLGGYRTDEIGPDHPVRRLRARLRHADRLVEVALAPLGSDQTRAVVAGLAPDLPAERVARVVRWSEGVPSLIRALALAPPKETGDVIGAKTGAVDRGHLVTADDRAPRDLPESVRDAVLLRLGGLTDAAAAALQALAVLGRVDDEPPRISEVTGLTGDPWPDEVDDSGLVAAEGERRRFRRALLGEAVYAGLGRARRRSLHRAAADRLAAGPPNRLPQAAIARHRLAAGDIAGARSALLAAADEAGAAHAHRDAVRLLGTALAVTAGDDPDRRDVLARLARHAEQAGDRATALDALGELLGNAAAAHRPDLLSRSAAQHELLGEWVPALTARVDAATAYEADGRPAAAAAERLAVAAHLRSAASFRAALDQLVLAERAAWAAGRVDLHCRAEGLRGNVLVRSGQVADGLAVVREALEVALRLSETATAEGGVAGPAAEIYQRLADSLEHAGDYRAAGRAYETAYDFCRVHADEVTGQLCRACATVVMLATGRWDAALVACREVLASDSATVHARAAAALVSGVVHALRGEAARARPLLLEARTRAMHIELTPVDLLATWGLALLDRYDGRDEPARTGYRHLLARVAASDERHFCLPALLDAALVLGPAGGADLGAVTALLADAAARDAEPLARAAFTVALAEGDPPAAVRHLRQALALVEDQDQPVADAQVRARLARALLAADPASVEARDLLAEARRTADRLHARLLLDDLDALAATLPDRPVEAAARLTPREGEVLGLVGEGLTNREIAQRLYLSVRTVEMHVGHAVSKLGCRNRAEAVRRLATGSQTP